MKQDFVKLPTHQTTMNVTTLMRIMLYSDEVSYTHNQLYTAHMLSIINVNERVNE